MKTLLGLGILLAIGCGIRTGTSASNAIVQLGAPDHEATLDDGRKVLTWNYTGWFWASCRHNVLVQNGRVVSDTSDCSY
jgi:hypothetical protein